MEEFPDELVATLSRGTGLCFVPEMNMGQVAGEVRKYADCEVVEFHQTDGRVISPLRIMETMEREV